MQPSSQPGHPFEARICRKDYLATFFLVTYIVSWTCFIAVAAATSRSGAASRAAIRAHAAVHLLLLLVGIFAPALVALWLTARHDGRTGVSALLWRLLQWRAGGRWYVFAVGYMLAIKLVGVLIFRVITGGWPSFTPEAWWVIAIAMVISTPVQSGEEIGWRGYALPRLADRFGFARASVVLGLLWGVWHLPIFFIQGGEKYGQSFPIFLLQVTALSVAITWLYVHTNGSLLLTMLMHSAINQSLGIVTSIDMGGTNPFTLRGTLIAWLTVVLLWIGASYFLKRMSGETPNQLMEVTPGRRTIQFSHD